MYTHTHTHYIPVVLESNDAFDVLVLVLQLGLYLMTELFQCVEILCSLQLNLAVNFSLFRWHLSLDKEQHKLSNNSTLCIGQET